MTTHCQRDCKFAPLLMSPSSTAHALGSIVLMPLLLAQQYVFALAKLAASIPSLWYNKSEHYFDKTPLHTGQSTRLLTQRTGRGLL